MGDEKAFNDLVGDPFLGPFFDTSFQPEAYVRSIVRKDVGIPSNMEETTAETTLHAVRERNRQIETLIRNLVSTHTETLVQAATHTHTLQQGIHELSSKSRSIQTIVNRIRQDVITPYHDLEKDNAILQNITATTLLIRKIKRTYISIRKLRTLVQNITTTPVNPSSSSVPPIPDNTADATSLSSTAVPSSSSSSSSSSSITITEALAIPATQNRYLSRLAPVIHEVETNLADPALHGIRILDNERAWVQSITQMAKEATKHLLHRATESLNSSDIGIALGALYELGCLGSESAEELDRLVDTAMNYVKEAFDIRSLSLIASSTVPTDASTSSSSSLSSILSTPPSSVPNRSTANPPSVPGSLSRGGTALLMPSRGAAPAWRGIFWGRCETLSENLQKICLQAWNILYVICRKREVGNTGSHYNNRNNPFLQALAQAYDNYNIPNDTSTHASKTRDKITPLAVEFGEENDTNDRGSRVSVKSAQKAAKQHPSDQQQLHPAVRLLRRFFLHLCSRFQNEISILAAEEGTNQISHTTFIRQTLVETYPRFHYLLLEIIPRTGRSVALRAADDEWDMVPRTDRFTSSVSKDGNFFIEPINGAQIFTQAYDSSALVKAASPLLRLYLARSIAKLSEAITVMFPPNRLQAIQGRRNVAQLFSTTSSVPNSTATTLNLNTNGFVVSTDMDKLLDEPAAEAPSIQATQAFVRLVTTELNACKPAGYTGGTMKPSSTATGTSGNGLFTMNGNTNGPSNINAFLALQTPVGPDIVLYEAVAKGIATALKLLVAQTESATVIGPAAVAVAEHWMPTPAQIANHALSCRLDEIRFSLIKLISELPLFPPFDRLSLLEDINSDPALQSMVYLRQLTHPLASSLPPHLLAITLAISKALRSNVGSNHVIFTAPQSILLRAIDMIDRSIESIISPWLIAVATPLERSVLRLHEATYTSLTVGGSNKTGNNTVPGNNTTTPNPAVANSSIAIDSEWIITLESYANGLVSHQLNLLPQGGIADIVRSTLAVRLLNQYVRFVCLIRSIDETGRIRIARDCAQFEVAISPLWSDLSRLGSAYQSLRALRTLCFASSVDIANAFDHPTDSEPNGTSLLLTKETQEKVRLQSTLLSLKGTDLLHALCARLPSECALPHTRNRITIVAYNDWLDMQVLPTLRQNDIFANASSLSNNGTSSSTTALLDATVLNIQEYGPTNNSSNPASLLAVQDPVLYCRCRLFSPLVSLHYYPSGGTYGNPNGKYSNIDNKLSIPNLTKILTLAVSEQLQYCLDDFATRIATNTLYHQNKGLSSNKNNDDTDGNNKEGKNISGVRAYVEYEILQKRQKWLA